jgi:hypothetical protein
MVVTKLALIATASLFLLGVRPADSMAQGLPPSLESSDLAQGPYAYMHMLLQKTLFRINIATIEVRVDKPTQARLAALASGKSYSDGLAEQLAEATIGAVRAVVQMKFKRDVSLDRWMGVVRENLGQARQAGLIDVGLEQKVSQGLPNWFSVLKSRGYEKSDRLIYEVSPDSLRTVVVSAGGQVLLDRLDREQGVRRVVLASYFAAKSDFREPLVRSLWDHNR